jgi:hypothetical protein
MSLISGLDDVSQVLQRIIQCESWRSLSASFSVCNRILLVGNGGNLAVCDHGAIDVSRLTDKCASAPGSGILASSLINDTSHDLWVKNWIKISLRGLEDSAIGSTLVIGVSSSGYSRNICSGLDYACSKGAKACLISAVNPKIPGNFSYLTLDVDEYHTAEVITLALIYQLIHEAGFACPSISKSSAVEDSSIDYAY